MVLWPEFDQEKSGFKKVKDDVIGKSSLDEALKQFFKRSSNAGSDVLSDSAKGARAIFENLSKIYRSEMALKSDTSSWCAVYKTNFD